MSDVHPSGDTTRPSLHLTADSGWINDPLGLTYRDGQYHLFFQYVPDQVEWRPDCHWGHATSDDLLHWTEHEVALAPGEGDDGCWSGSIVTPSEGEPALFYTTVSLDDAQIGRVRVAHPRAADWNAWAKGEVLAALPEGVDAVAYRDPFVFHDGDRWRMLMGAGLADGTATALVHSSRDLRTWTFDGELAGRHTGESDPLWTGRVWECPQLFPMGDKWVLTVSVWEPLVLHYEAYAVGSYADGRFTPEHWGRLTYGPSYYAGSTFTDAEGRRGLIYWLRGVADEGRRWTGANSIPHLLTPAGGVVAAEPHPNLVALREPGMDLLAGDAVAIAATADIDWQVPPGSDGAALVIAAESGEEVLSLREAGGSLQACTPDGEWAMPLDGGSVRVVLDGPVAEVFASSGCMALPLRSAGGLVVTVTSGCHATAYGLKAPVTAG